MNSEIFAFAVAVAVFAGGCVGLVLQRVLHEKHTTGPSRDMIGAVVGLFTLLCALVTGLLIWTAYGVYAGQNTAIQTLASKVLQFDLALADYGPEANAERAKLRQNIGKAVDEIGDTSETDTNFATTSITGAIELIRNREKALESLHPSTDEQKKALAAATSAVESIGQGRLQMSTCCIADVGATHPSAWAGDVVAAPKAIRSAATLFPGRVDRNRQAARFIPTSLPPF